MYFLSALHHFVLSFFYKSDIYFLPSPGINGGRALQAIYTLINDPGVKEFSLSLPISNAAEDVPRSLALLCPFQLIFLYTAHRHLGRRWRQGRYIDALIYTYKRDRERAHTALSGAEREI